MTKEFSLVDNQPPIENVVDNNPLPEATGEIPPIYPYKTTPEGYYDFESKGWLIYGQDVPFP